jgi:hypothetical protein
MIQGLRAGHMNRDELDKLQLPEWVVDRFKNQWTIIETSLEA